MIILLPPVLMKKVVSSGRNVTTKSMNDSRSLIHLRVPPQPFAASLGLLKQCLPSILRPVRKCSTVLGCMRPPAKQTRRAPIAHLPVQCHPKAHKQAVRRTEKMSCATDCVCSYGRSQICRLASMPWYKLAPLPPLLPTLNRRRSTAGPGSAADSTK